MHLVHKGPLPLVRDAPLQKIALFELLQNIFVRFVRKIAGHAGAIAQLDLPAAHVSEDAQTLFSKERSSEPIYGDLASGVRYFGSEVIHLYRVHEICQLSAVHPAEDAVISKDIVKQDLQCIGVFKYVFGRYDDVRVKSFDKPANIVKRSSWICLHDQSPAPAGKLRPQAVLYLAVSSEYSSFTVFDI